MYKNSTWFRKLTKENDSANKTAKLWAQVIKKIDGFTAIKIYYNGGN